LRFVSLIFIPVLCFAALVLGQCRPLPFNDPIITLDSVMKKYPVDWDYCNLRVYHYADELDVSGDYISQFSTEKVYDDSGKVMNYRSFSSWGSTNFTYNKKTRYLYDGDRVAEIFDTTANISYEVATHTLFRYADTGFCTTVRKYNETGGLVVGSGVQYRFTYDAFGHLLEYIEADSTTPQITIFHRTSYAYDAQGCLSEKLQQYMQDSVHWTNMYRESWNTRADTTVTCTLTHSYSVSLKRISVSQNWMSVDTAWADAYKQIYYVDGTGIAYYYQSYQAYHGSWIGGGVSTYVYDRYGRYLGTSGGDAWIVTYDSSGRVRQILSGGMGQTRSTFLYLPVKAISTELRPVTVSPAAFLISPNPVTESAVIRVFLERSASLEINVYGLNGKRVCGIYAGQMGKGPGRIRWDLKDDHGKPVASGIYHVRLKAGDGQWIKRIQVIR
jgi:hypothetical protein